MNIKIPLFTIYLFMGFAVLYGQQTRIDSLAVVLPKTQSYEEKIKILNELSLLLQRTNPDSALSTIEIALQLSREKNDQKRIAESLKNMGNIYYGKNNPTKAQKNYDQAIEIFETLQDTLGLAKIYNNMGALWRAQGLYKEALDSYQKSLELRYLINDSAGMGKTYNNIGNMHYSLGDLETALKYYKQSLSIRVKYNDQLGIGGCYTNMGLVYIEKEHYDSAISHLNKAMKIHTEFGDIEGVAHCESTIGYAYLKTNKPDQSIEILNKALDKYKRLTNVKGIAKTLNLLAEAYNSMENYGTAIRFANQTLHLDSGKTPIAERMEAHNQLSQALEKTGNYSRALENYKQHIALKENLMSVEKMKEIEIIERQYQSETQKLIIKNLENDNRIKVILVEKLKTRQLFSYIAFIIAAGFIIFLLITRKKLQKKNETIRTQNEVITKHKNQLEKHQNHLEQLIQERTVDLIKAKEQAEESDRLKSAFLANMSHEIRTPMNAIVGFTELLNMTDHDEETKTLYLHLVQQNSNVLLQLMDDIIDIAKIEAGQIRIQQIRTNINDILTYVEKTLAQKCNNTGKQHLEIKTIIADTITKTEIITDPIRLQQILTNLTDNALKFTDDGQIVIKIDMKNHNNLLFSVEDTGIGMSQEQINGIFDRFNKTDNNPTKLYRGAGLGLAISKNLVELLGGEIWVTSTPRVGSQFFFTIPYNKL